LCDSTETSGTQTPCVRITTATAVAQVVPESGETCFGWRDCTPNWAAANAHAANYPFCTIDPNVGIVPVPDARMDRIVGLVKPNSIVPTTMEFIDIAGIVEGASKGEGLGNQFLSHIRQTDAILHVF